MTTERYAWRSDGRFWFAFNLFEPCNASVMERNVPMMPHLAEECWAALDHKTLVASEDWPKVESQLLIEDTITLPIQINGKKRAEVTINRRATNGEIKAAVLALDAVKKALGGQSPKKVIVVPQRIVNVVV